MAREKAATTDLLGLRVAQLGLWLDARGTTLRLSAPPAHTKFLQPRSSEVSQTSNVSADLVLRVRNGLLPRAQTRPTPLCRTKIWELWQDTAGHYVFVAPRQSPPRWIVVDPGFTEGEVLGDFASSDGEGLYPPQGLDNVVLANWLASYGDVILHASGVAVDGKGYCFIGPAGAGKSTLAASLMSASRDAAEAGTTKMEGVVVLGEDQVILRHLDGRFRIYGTPWHEDPAMCSPLGVPLEKVFFLHRAAASGVEPLGPADGVVRLLQTAFIPYYRAVAVSTILDRLADLSEEVPFYTLSYQLGADARGLIRDA